MFQAVENMKVQWLCINDITGSTTTWANTESTPPLIWLIQNVFTSNDNATIFNAMLPLVTWQLQSFAQLISNSPTYNEIHGLDSTFIPTDETRDVTEWIRVMMEIVNDFFRRFDTFNQGLLWILQVFMVESNCSKHAAFIEEHMPNHWQFYIS